MNKDNLIKKIFNESEEYWAFIFDLQAKNIISEKTFLEIPTLGEELFALYRKDKNSLTSQEKTIFDKYLKNYQK